MFFWTRSLLCIGTIVVLVSGRSGDVVPAASRLTLGTPPASLAVGAMNLCRIASGRCMAVVNGGEGTPDIGDMAVKLLRQQNMGKAAQASPPRDRRMGAASSAL